MTNFFRTTMWTTL